jgi:hypothetical protein
MLDGVADSPTAQQPSINRTPRLSLDPNIRHLETHPIADRCGYLPKLVLVIAQSAPRRDFCASLDFGAPVRLAYSFWSTLAFTI